MESSDPIDEQLRIAFASQKWPYAQIPEPNTTKSDMEETLKHIYRFDDDVKNFYLPKLLSEAITPSFKSAGRSDWLRRLITFLDVDFEARTPGIDALLKQTRVDSFASYNRTQSRAILSWLDFVKRNFLGEILRTNLNRQFVIGGHGLLDRRLKWNGASDEHRVNGNEWAD